ncbi:MAG: GNAT family N-acetyltransferase [SAR86 cluster bacterium]|uniref:GNAT family N-acetyltransferase n=1 Tax=SAR86 cluster bacterium TaxID=2030880 RepID=A0A2A4XI48_9GAMM|nr:MAG: GNAT family N-acetyltransferase [SAR86 cluster bacterium]
MIIRAENKEDFAAVQAIHLSAFPEAGESKLVTRLRENAQPIISLVAEVDGELVGHILFSPVTLDSKSSLQLMGLAPMAVLPSQQRQGIGCALVKAGLAQCLLTKNGAVAVLGHPDFYPKFGFEPSTSFAIKSEYDVPAEVFMVVELEKDYLNGCSGTISYHEEFKSL